MKRVLKLGKVSGIQISVHWTFLILIAWILVVGLRAQQSTNEIIFTILFVLSLFVCVVLHELGHALTAKRYGIRTRSITLLPIGGVAQMEELPENPKQELLIALAGPAVNVVLAFVFYALALWFDAIPNLFEVFVISGQTFLYYLFTANVVLVLFNLLPAFPMDGGRVLRAILSFFTNRDRATRIAAVTGQALAVGFVGIGIFYNPFLVFIGIFVFLGAMMESEYVHTSFLLKDHLVKDIAINKFHVLKPEDKLSEAIKLLLNVQAKDFIVMENDKVVGTLSREGIIQAISEKGTEATVASAMNPNFMSVTPDTNVGVIYKQMSTNKQSIFPIISDNKLLGIIDLENILEMIMVLDAKAKYHPHGHALGA